MIQKPVARQIVIDADHVGRARPVPEELEFSLADGFAQVAPQRMILADAAAKQVEAQPAPVVFECGLLPEFRRRENPPQVFGLDQLGLRADRPDLFHRKHGGAALVDQRPEKIGMAFSVGVPMAVEAAEARRRQRFVDRRVFLDPWIAFGHAPRVACKHLCELRLEDFAVTGSVAVMAERRDDFDAEIAQL